MSDEKSIPEVIKNRKLDEILADAKEPEDKIKVSLDFMRCALSQEGSPRLRDFWEAKAACLPLFKQRLSPAARSYFWEEFVSLSDEARRLKDVLDEQSAFAADAIDKAIDAIEKDFQQLETFVLAYKPCTFPKGVESLLTNSRFYHESYAKIGVLTSFSTRINGLKQEVSKTSMRVRQKGRIFQKLQELRTQILPLRNDLVAEVSKVFLNDVSTFVSLHENTPSKPFYVLRDDIKGLQELSKILSISTEAFGKVRELLSGLWDQIRMLDKERKKAQGDKREAQQKNHDEALLKIESLEKRIEEEKLNSNQARSLFNEMHSYLRGLDLNRDHIKPLKVKLSELQDALEAPKQSVNAEKADAMDAKSAETARKHAEEAQLVAEAIVELADSDIETIEAKIEALQEQIASKELLDPILDLRIETKQAMLLEQDEVLVSDVENLLQMRQEQRERLRARIGALRKNLATSSLDLEKSMQLGDELDQLGGTLESVEEAIKALNELIADA
ncbi:MAG: hypothetical protein KDK50_04805 [Chlamydiia bacterium]|nr:hypothetical protein [Chlamydiia bacterium]